MNYFSIFQNDIAPFFYVYSDKNVLVECDWLLKRTDLRNLEYKKNNFIEKQLKEYFNKNLKKFDLKFNKTETRKFSDRVLDSIYSIPFGNFKTYKDIAESLNNPNAARAVGQICRKNKFPLIIPCHRVISNRGIGGYAGRIDDNSLEIEIKKRLLEFEGLFAR